MTDIFSKRIGVSSTPAPITIRYEATAELRDYMLLLIQPYIPSYKAIRQIVCSITMTSPDRNNWGENDFIKDEIIGIFENCQWYHIYDVVESVYNEIPHQLIKDDYEKKVNEYFVQKGIGWKMVNGVLEIRGDEVFEEKISEASAVLAETGLETSANEIKEAIKDLSKKPEPEITGSIQHAVAALECVARKVTGCKDTLGDLIKKNPNIVPSPLDIAISKIFGYASEWGRHLREGRNPEFDEAELIVHLSASMCTYLCKKHFPSPTIELDELPF